MDCKVNKTTTVATCIENSIHVMRERPLVKPDAVTKSLIER